MSVGDNRNYIPIWGQLPVEQFLIRNWDSSSSEPADSQRKHLVDKYMQLDSILKEWDPAEHGMYPERQPTRIPTEDEIDTILRPWRSDDMRRRAWQIWCGANSEAPVMLRTHYGGISDPAEGSNDDSRHGDDDATTVEFTECSELYAMGADWSVLTMPTFFYILPEIAGCKRDYERTIDPERLDRKFAGLEAALDEAKSEHPDWKQDWNLLLEDNFVARGLLFTATISWIWIVDKEAFETEQLLVVYFDRNQNVTVQGRMEIDQGYLDELTLNWYEGAPPGTVIEEGSVGDTYRLDTESGRRFFRLTDSDLIE
ncbi:uncharacterized protein BDV17DRAFT_297270 [Aspergillus undulatus]|uniref:uncharacterized protein n=1 Tax=Aspergillus undulatus TaxID=1810928 RepID=UPI003CCD1378